MQPCFPQSLTCSCHNKVSAAWQYSMPFCPLKRASLNTRKLFSRCSQLLRVTLNLRYNNHPQFRIRGLGSQFGVSRIVWEVYPRSWWAIGQTLLDRYWHCNQRCHQPVLLRCIWHNTLFVTGHNVRDTGIVIWGQALTWTLIKKRVWCNSHVVFLLMANRENWHDERNARFHSVRVSIWGLKQSANR